MKHPYKLKEMERLLVEKGFEFVSQNGSHRKYKHPKGVALNLVRNRNGEMSRGLVSHVLRVVDALDSSDNRN